MKSVPQTQNNITTQNLVPTGTATAGSAVEIFPANAASLAVEVTGTYTGALSAQVTVDGTTWTTLTGEVFAPINGGAATATIASGSTGKWTVALSAWSGFRITALAAVTGTAVVSLNQGNGGGATLGEALAALGSDYTSAPTVTRPANTDAYIAGDVVGGLVTFTNFGPTGGGGVFITGASLMPYIASLPSGMTGFTFQLYNASPASPLSDNAPWVLADADRTAYLGPVSIGTPTDLGGTLYAEVNQVNKQILTAGTSIYGYIVTVGGFTPAANSEVYVPRLSGVGV